MNKQSKRQTIQHASIIAACLVTLVMVARENVLADRIENMSGREMTTSAQEAAHTITAESSRLAHDALARAQKARRDAEEAASEADAIARKASAAAKRAADSAARIARMAVK